MNMTAQEIQNSIDSLNIDDREYLLSYGDPVLRKFMSSEEIKKCNRLVKLGVLCKGMSDDKKTSVCYYVDSYVYSRL